MKNFILTSKQFQREFLASFSIIQHLLYGLLIPVLLLISLLAWDPKVFVFIFLAYSCGLIGFIFAKALTQYEQSQQERSASSSQNVEETLVKERSLVEKEYESSASKVNLSNLMTAHDLKEPLRQVYSYSQLLEKKYGAALDTNGTEYLNFILQGAKRMHQMMEDISALSRMEHEGTRQTAIDLSDLVQYAVSTLQLKIEESQAQITHDPLPTVKGDPGQLRHLLLNLISNAIKYHGEEPPRIHISVEEAKTIYKFSVVDNGIGIEKGQLKEVFGLFRRLHGRSKFEGTGIGLAICKQIVENHNGKIGVESAGESSGSCFWFTLPK